MEITQNSQSLHFNSPRADSGYRAGSLYQGSADPGLHERRDAGPDHCGRPHGVLVPAAARRSGARARLPATCSGSSPSRRTATKNALVIDVIKDGPACHTGAESCFFNPVYVSDELKQFTWQGLYELIKGRKTDPKEGSYTSYLFDKGLEKILKKVGEESTEVIIAGSKRDKEEDHLRDQRPGLPRDGADD